jgi:hypothetical protein
MAVLSLEASLLFNFFKYFCIVHSNRPISSGILLANSIRALAFSTNHLAVDSSKYPSHSCFFASALTKFSTLVIAAL